MAGAVAGEGAIPLAVAGAAEVAGVDTLAEAEAVFVAAVVEERRCDQHRPCLLRRDRLHRLARHLL